MSEKVESRAIGAAPQRSIMEGRLLRLPMIHKKQEKVAKPAVSSLSLDQALAELEQLLDARPPEEEVAELQHWQRDHAARAQELETRILEIQSHEDELPPAAEVALGEISEPTLDEPCEVPMILKKKESTEALSPLDQLENLRTRLLRAVEECKSVMNQRTYDKARNRVNQYRFAIKTLVREHGLPMPDLPFAPESRWPSPKGKKRKQLAEPIDASAEPESAAPAVHPLPQLQVKSEPAPEAQGSPVRETPCPLQEAARKVRRDMYRLLADMEDLDPKDRAALRPELATLQSLAEQALHLVDEAAVPLAG